MTRFVFLFHGPPTPSRRTILVVRIHAALSSRRLSLSAEKRGRPRCHGNSISTRGPRTLEPPSSRGKTCGKGDGGAEAVSIPAVEFSRRGNDLVERGTFRDRVVHHRYTPFRTLLRGPRVFFAFPPVFFSLCSSAPFLSFLPSSFSSFFFGSESDASYVQARNFR